MLKFLIGFIFLAASIFAVTPVESIQQDIYNARDRVMPALVHIQPVIKDYNTGELEKQAVIGSGVIFHKDGYVVTNYHVAGRAERILCTLSDKEIVPAKFIGGDPLTDIAVLKLDLSNYSGKIKVAEFGNSDSVQVGQYVIAMGSPLALSRSISVGVISTKDRYFGSDVRLPSGERTGRYNLWIQTDAAINPGNSGGPLVDLQGQIIGINSRATLYANNIGFAIPINIVKKVTDIILTKGKVTRSWIGLHCQALQELENYFGANRNSGVLIASIDPGSPAEKSFLRAGDIILEVDGQPVSARFVEELPKFYSLIADHKPGSEISLKVLRNEQEYTFKVTTKQLGDLQGEDFECKKWGFTVKAITKQMQIDYQLTDTVGAFVVGVKPLSTADNGGLRRADVIVKVNNDDLKNFSDFIDHYDKYSLANVDKVLLTIKRSGATRYVLLKVDNNKGDTLDEK
ncbi:MAG: PDZ domain-containing protein [FCB group bacterium]|nr:PDZ domain-containing protein [FCB group bacterium]